jgi:hypothetical protein
MKFAASFLLLICLSVATFAKDKPKITIEVVDSQSSQRQWTQYVPGTNGHSETTCDTNGTALDTGNVTTVNGTTNCTTTTTPGSPASTVQHSIAQEHVHAIMADGTHITLWCQNGFRRCASLSAGAYSAEVSGNSLFIYAHQLDGKEMKIKYHYVGGW